VGLQERMLERLPVGIRIHPLETSICVMGVPAGISIGLRFSNSRALDVLPEPILTAWAVIWTIGCIAWFVGLVLSDEKEYNGGLVIRHVPALLLGLWFVFVTSLIYGIAVLVVGGLSGLFAAVAPLCIAGGTYIRRVDLQRRIKGERDWPESTEQ
jgi:hypothetical protein